MSKRFPRAWLRCWTLAAITGHLGACGGNVSSEGRDPAIDAGPDVHLRPIADAGSGGSGGKSKPDANLVDVVEASRFDAYKEVKCPNAPPVEPIFECDPLGTGDCTEGTACYPFPPQGSDPCNPGPYRMRCATVGTANQGESCGNGRYCVGGHVCAVTAQGDQCLKLCRVGAIGACSDGLVCARLDLPGLGGCL